jgi:hypothetical protein
VKVSKDFKELLKLLNKNNIKYITAGGYALGYHSRPRYTEDIDIWIEASYENAEKNILDVEALFATNLPMNREYIQHQLAELHITPHQKIINIILQ